MASHTIRERCKEHAFDSRTAETAWFRSCLNTCQHSVVSLALAIPHALIRLCKQRRTSLVIHGGWVRWLGTVRHGMKCFITDRNMDSKVVQARSTDQVEIESFRKSDSSNNATLIASKSAFWYSHTLSLHLWTCGLSRVRHIAIEL